MPGVASMRNSGARELVPNVAEELRRSNDHVSLYPGQYFPLIRGLEGSFSVINHAQGEIHVCWRCGVHC